VNGHFDPRYESLVELFYALGAKQPAGGSSLAVYKDGKEVVNVWQGSATADSPWQQETISDVFSCTKGIISIIAARLIDQGFLDPNQRVSFYWPEFAAAGKADVTVATVLQHKAGLSAPRRDLTHEQALDRDFVIAELAGQEPLWAPGTIHGYHALTFGHLVSKLIESVTGLTAGQYLQKHIAGPLGADMWIGLPAEQLGRVATLISDGGFNDAETLAAELAGANGVTNARGLARIYSAAVTDTDGIRLVSDEALKAACVPASYGENAWHEIGPYPVWGNGFMLNSLRTATPGANGFGHDGLGGQAGWGNIEHRLGFGYTTTYLLSSAETQGNQQSLVAELNRILVG
jgi:CubicO group peptidase (beta-lactamase class C family)